MKLSQAAVDGGESLIRAAITAGSVQPPLPSRHRALIYSQSLTVHVPVIITDTKLIFNAPQHISDLFKMNGL